MKLVRIWHGYLFRVTFHNITKKPENFNGQSVMQLKQ